jgi:hypothetical protein
MILEVENTLSQGERGIDGWGVVLPDGAQRVVTSRIGLLERTGSRENRNLGYESLISPSFWSHIFELQSYMLEYRRTYT